MKVKKKCGEISCVRYDTNSILCEYCEQSKLLVQAEQRKGEMRHDEKERSII